MIGSIKQKIRYVIEKKYDDAYFKEWNLSTCSYEEWLRKHKIPEQDRIHWIKNKNINDKVSIIEWAQLKDIHDFSKENLGEIIIFTHHKKGLRQEAIPIILSVFWEKEEIQVVYGDEDEINYNETVRMNPWFKPDYSPDTLLSYYYFGNVIAVRKQCLKDVLLDTEWDIKEKIYGLTLQICIPLSREFVFHCREMFYTSHNISYWGFEEKYLKIKEKYQILRKKVQIDGVSVIIPSKDNPKVLERCLRSIVKWTEDVVYEIIVVDNGSSEENKYRIEKLQKEMGFQYLYVPKEFNFSFMCNLGTKSSQYKLFLFLNDDCEVLHSGWMKKMVDQTKICETGAVGAKLYYPNSKTIQHCGIYGLYVGPAHKLQFKEDVRSYYDRRNLDIRNVLAVTGACLMVRKEVFEQVGGFEEKFQVAFNDVDLCYKIYKAGYNNVINNEVQLWHHESLSRGSDDSPEKMLRHRRERDRLYENHKDLWSDDPYYHPGLTSYHLDINYSYAYEYEIDREKIIFENCKKIKKLPKKLREDSCLVPMIEYAGDIKEWYIKKEEILELTERRKSKKIVYFQGNMVVLGSNNSYFDKRIILENIDNESFYQIRPKRIYRPDIFTNLPDQKNVALSGFAFLLDLELLPQGEYKICAMAKDKISGQYLFRRTSLRLERD